MILAGIVLLLGILGGLLLAARGSSGLSPRFLGEFVLYALSAADLTMLVALLFVLGRNIVKLIVERRRALPFARFRTKLVAALLGMTLIPAVLVLIVGSELIRSSLDRWYNAPMDDVLTSARAIASDYYYERQLFAAEAATRVADTLTRIDFQRLESDAIREWLLPEITQDRIQQIAVYRVASRRGEWRVIPVVEVSAPTLDARSAEENRAELARLALRAVEEAGSPDETLDTGGAQIRAAAVIRRQPDAAPDGVVVVGERLTGDVVAQARQITGVYEEYSQARVLQRPLTGVYLSFFLMVTLLILVSATWMGFYLAKRITQPVERLAAGTRAIAAGHLDYRVERGDRSADEFSGLIDAFNSMAGELARSRHRLEAFTTDLERKHTAGETRRRYIEMIMEHAATGVVSVDADGRISTLNPAAGHLLALGPDDLGRPIDEAFERPDLMPLRALLTGESRTSGEPRVQDVAMVRDGRELHVAAVATALQGEDGSHDGRVLVLDDVTPLVRAQRVAAWREVARRLAHEIKNPLTPIRLSAERLSRYFSGAPETTRTLVDECTSTIVGEVESLKTLVDEFSQFARMPAPRTTPTDLHRLLEDVLALYQDLLGGVRFQRRFARELPLVTLDPEQIKRVVINLIDNAIEAMHRSGTIMLETHLVDGALARIVVADDGPGMPAADRDKLFLPYYSTKRRGSGLGLAIVRRIVSEHGGTIEVADRHPRGTQFVVDLPLSPAPVAAPA